MLPGSDQAATELEVLDDEGESAEGGEGVLGGADLDEDTANIEQVEVLVDLEAGAGNGGDEDVDAVGVVGGPVLVLAGSDELVSTELEGVLLLGRRARDGDDLVALQCLGEKDGEVAETTDTDDTDTLAGASTVGNQGVVDGDTTAQHRCSELRRNLLWDRDGVGTGTTPHLCITTESLAALLGVVPVVVGVRALLALGLLAVLAAVALQAAVALSTNTDAVAQLDVLHCASDTGNFADDLVTNDERVV